MPQVRVVRCAALLNGESPAHKPLPAPEHLRARTVHAESILTSFRRLDAPRLMETADLLQPKYLATSSMSSAFALPSEAGDRSCANQVPPSSCCSPLATARGLTFTSMNLATWLSLE